MYQVDHEHTDGKNICVLYIPLNAIAGRLSQILRHNFTSLGVWVDRGTSTGDDVPVPMTMLIVFVYN